MRRRAVIERVGEGSGREFDGWYGGSREDTDDRKDINKMMENLPQGTQLRVCCRVDLCC